MVGNVFLLVIRTPPYNQNVKRKYPTINPLADDYRSLKDANESLMNVFNQQQYHGRHTQKKCNCYSSVYHKM